MAGAPVKKVQSATLATGEVFVLPPGATLIGVTDPALITSTCPIPTTLETIACYSALLTSGGSSSNDSYWEEHAKIVAIVNNGVKIDMPDVSANAQGCFHDDHGKVIAEFIKLNVPGITAIAWVADWDGSASDRGCMTWVTIVTVPSVAKNLFIRAESDIDAAIANSGSDISMWYAPFRLNSEWTTDGYSNFPVCPLPPPAP